MASLASLGKRPDSRKSMVRRDTPTMSSTRSTSGPNQTPIGRAPDVTHNQERVDSPDVATSVNVGPTRVPSPNQSHRPISDKNAVEVEFTGVVELGAIHGTELGAGGLANDVEALDNNADDLRSGFMPLKSSRIWDTYMKKADEEDRDLVEDWDRIIDVTLVFAALFSAVSTAFVLESSKNLQVDQGKAAVLAIRDLTSVVQAGINASLGVPPLDVPVLSSPEDSFQPTTATTRVNCLWFLSLGLSISVSLLAMLAKRWCYVFSRVSRGFGTSYERAINRQKAWDAIELWKMELVIEQLPTLMHVALSKWFPFVQLLFASDIPQNDNVLTKDVPGSWGIRFPGASVNETKPFPSPNEDYRQAFCAIVWLLTCSKDRAVIQQGLEYLNTFPEVIMDSSAISDHLYTAVSTVVRHLEQLPTNTTRTNQTAFKSASLGLLYLAGHPWLHHAIGRGTYYEKISHLFFSSCSSDLMTPADFEAQFVLVKDKVPELSGSISGLDSLGVEMILHCNPAGRLTICSTLGKLVLARTTQLQVRNPISDIHLALWWIFLSCTSHHTYTLWPHQNAHHKIWLEGAITGDSMLTLKHLRSQKVRQESALWLTIVGISGMLYTFAHYPGHEGGPTVESNEPYFIELTSILRSALYTLVATESLSASIGELPVCHKTQVCLWKFDSLEYGSAALDYILHTNRNLGSALSENLQSLSAEFHTLNSIKWLKNLLPTQAPTCPSIEDIYIGSSRSPCMWMASGLLNHKLENHLNLTKEHAYFLSRLVPDILFGTPNTPASSGDQIAYFSLSTNANWDRYVEACVDIAILTCLPSYHNLSAFRDAFGSANPSYMRHDRLWKPLHQAGLIQISLERTPERDGSITSSRPQCSSLSPHANGYWLYIKASLIERLHSFQADNPLSPDTLEWTIALSDHFAELLDHWNDAEMNADEQAYVIGSLTKMVNTLLAAPNPNKTPESSTAAGEGTSLAQIQLEKLIQWDILPILARPFSVTFPPVGTSDRILDASAWYKDLVETIDRLAHEFPLLASSAQYTPLYSNLVAYYEARAPEDFDRSSPMLEFVQRLRDDMKVHQFA